MSCGCPMSPAGTLHQHRGPLCCHPLCWLGRAPVPAGCAVGPGGGRGRRGGMARQGGPAPLFGACSFVRRSRSAAASLPGPAGWEGTGDTGDRGWVRGAGDAEQQVPVSPGCCHQPRRFPVLALPFLSLKLFFSRQEEFEASFAAGSSVQAGAGRAVPTVRWPGDARRSPQQAPGAGCGYPRVLAMVCRQGAARWGVEGPVLALAWVLQHPGGLEGGFGSSGVSAPGCASVSLVCAVPSLPGHGVSPCSWGALHGLGMMQPSKGKVIIFLSSFNPPMLPFLRSATHSPAQLAASFAPNEGAGGEGGAVSQLGSGQQGENPAASRWRQPDSGVSTGRAEPRETISHPAFPAPGSEMSGITSSRAGCHCLALLPACWGCILWVGVHRWERGCVPPAKLTPLSPQALPRARLRSG